MTTTTVSKRASKNSYKKLALVLGNSNYRQGRTLRYSLNHARDVHDKLVSIHFQVTLGLDLNCDQTDDIIEEFVQKISPGDLVFFFYSGYGINWNERNCILPIDDHMIVELAAFRYQAISLPDIFEMIMARNPMGGVFFIDACRSYPLSYMIGLNGTKDFGGFIPFDPLPGMFLVLTCEPTKLMPDYSTNARSCSFIRHLLGQIDQANLSITEMMDIINEDMRDENSTQLFPYQYNTLRKEIYLNYQAFTGAKHQLHPRLEKIIAQSPERSLIDLKNEGITDRDMESIVQQVIINKQCARLWLASNKIAWMGASVLSASFANNTVLERVFLYSNPLGDKGIKYLMKALGVNNHIIKILHLQDTGMSDHGVDYIAEMLTTNKTITSLWIGKNDITDGGVQHLAKSLATQNNTLEFLDLSNCRGITDASVHYLIEMIKTNRVMNELDMHNCRLTNSGKEKIRQGAKAKYNFTVCVNSWNE